MTKYIIYGLIIYAVVYFYSKNKKKLTPEEIAAQEAEKARLAQEQLLLEQKKESERLEVERKRMEEEKKREAKEIENERLRMEEEQKLLNEMLHSTQRVYFSYALVNESSPMYLIHPSSNMVMQASETTLKQLYAEGWKLLDVDKTGKSAQLNDFNFVLRLSKN
jgi:Skp family chaperone for outer membrane proteins